MHIIGRRSLVAQASTRLSPSSETLFRGFPYPKPVFGAHGRTTSRWHICARGGFALAFQQALLAGSSDELDERMKFAYHEELNVTLSIMAAYQSFATGFIPHGQDQPLLDPREIWVLSGIEAYNSFVPPPLQPELLSIAEAYRAPVNAAYR